MKPFLKSNKNDFLDAEAIAEAVARQNMRFVPIKTDDQLDLQALHRVRDRLVQRRTAVINQIRGFLMERGIAFPKATGEPAQQHGGVAGRCRAEPLAAHAQPARDLWQEWKQLEADIAEADDEIERIASADASCQRLRQIPGVGPLVSTATVAAIGNGAAFRKGREFAAWLGLVPKQAQPAARPDCWASASAATNICAACSSMAHAPCCYRVKYDTGGFGQWVHQLEARAPRNKVIVAIANKLARIAWAVLFSGEVINTSLWPRRKLAVEKTLRLES